MAVVGDLTRDIFISLGQTTSVVPDYSGKPFSLFRVTEIQHTAFDDIGVIGQIRAIVKIRLTNVFRSNGSGGDKAKNKDQGADFVFNNHLSIGFRKAGFGDRTTLRFKLLFNPINTVFSQGEFMDKVDRDSDERSREDDIADSHK